MITVRRTVYNNLEFMDGLKNYVDPEVYANREATDKIWVMLKDCEVTAEELACYHVCTVKEFLTKVVEHMDESALREFVTDAIEYHSVYDNLMVDLFPYSWCDCWALDNYGKETYNKDMLILYCDMRGR